LSVSSAVVKDLTSFVAFKMFSVSYCECSNAKILSTYISLFVCLFIFYVFIHTDMLKLQGSMYKQVILNSQVFDSLQMADASSHESAIWDF